MVTLTRITDPVQLEEYFRFRYRIYSESLLKGFLDDKSGLDQDAYDARAMHYGWFVDGALVGCVRFVEPDGSDKPLPMFAYLTDASVIDAVSVYLTMRKAHGQRMVEASRFCLAPEHRGVKTAKEFVLAMAILLQTRQINHALFDCSQNHAEFYQALGFVPLGGTKPFYQHEAKSHGYTLSYTFAHVLARNPGMMEGLGFSRGRLAA